MATFGERAIGAAQLNTAIYEEVENDQGATGQAAGVVVLASVAAGIGAIVHGGVGGLVANIVGGLAGWVVWSYLTWWIGTKWLPEPKTNADPGQLLRTLGFASAPGVLNVLGIVPALGALVRLVVFVWMLVAGVIAVRQALDYSSTGRAVGVVVIGLVVQAVILVVLLSLLGAAAW